MKNIQSVFLNLVFAGRDLILTFTYFDHLNEVHSHVKAVLFLSILKMSQAFLLLSKRLKLSVVAELFKSWMEENYSSLSTVF